MSEREVKRLQRACEHAGLRVTGRRWEMVSRRRRLKFAGLDVVDDVSGYTAVIYSREDLRQRKA